MKKRRSTKLIHEGRYIAEVDIDLLVLQVLNYYSLF
jgi:hypothetical protein